MDRLTEMEAFATVVDQGGFTDAAKKMGISKSAVSKHVSALEARLGARLLNRTTRRVSPTEIGLAYYDRARRVLNDAGEADALVTSMQSAPSARCAFRWPPISGSICYCRFLGISAGISRYHREHGAEQPLCRTDFRRIFDLAIRVGDLEDSSLRARKLTETTKRMIGAPNYFQKYGRPMKIDDLNEHKVAALFQSGQGNVWKVTAPSGEKRQVCSVGWLTVNDGQSLLNAAVSGLASPICPRSSAPRR